MAAPVDFGSVMADLTVFQEAIGKIQAGLKNKTNKEILGDVLNRLQEARVEAEESFPKAMDLIVSTAQQAKAEAEQTLGQLAQTKAAVEQRTAQLQAAQGAVPAKAAPPEQPVDPALGQKLRVELLRQFGPSDTESDDSGKIREAWQDWE